MDTTSKIENSAASEAETEREQQNQYHFRRLIAAIQASYGKLNLLIAICDNGAYRDELIAAYEAALLSLIHI